mgnify:CR=1 FL=1
MRAEYIAVGPILNPNSRLGRIGSEVFLIYVAPTMNAVARTPCGRIFSPHAIMAVGLNRGGYPDVVTALDRCSRLAVGE